MGNLSGPGLEESALRPAQGTCEWFLKEPMFEEWLAGRGPASLWVQGTVGRGKTVLSSFLVDRIPVLVSKVPPLLPVNTCYFSCDGKSNKQKDVLTIMISLLHQILVQRNELFNHIKREWEKPGQRVLQNFDALWKVFLETVQDPRAGVTFVVIDSIDECEDLTQIKYLDLFSGLVESKGGRDGVSHGLGKVRILFTTSSPMDVQRNPIIHMEDKANLDKIGIDIEHEIENRMDEIAKIHSCTAPVRMSLEVRIRRQADTLFLWVALVFGELRRAKRSSYTHLKSIIDAMPTGWWEIYARILSTLDGSERQDAVLMLKIIAGALKPLKLEEFGLAVSVGRAIGTCSQQTLSGIEGEVEPNVERNVRMTLGSLVRITDGRVQFVHNSIRSYLGGHTSSTSPPEPFAIQPETAQLGMAKMCTTYLSLLNVNKEFVRYEPHVDTQTAAPLTSDQDYLDLSNTFEPLDIWELKDRYKLFDYCSMNWASHVSSAGKYIFDDSQLMNDIIAICTHKSEVLFYWLRHYWDSVGYGQEDLESFDILVTASFLGLETVFNYAIKENIASIDQSGPAALYFASTSGERIIVQILLSGGVCATFKGREGWTPLMRGAAAGHYEVVKALLPTHPDVNALNSRGRSALSLAVGNGHYDVAKLLLEHEGINMDQTDHKSCTLLIHAMEGGNPDMIRLLFAHSNVKVNHQDKNGRTALSYAAENGHVAAIEVLQELRRKQLDGGLEDDHGHSPLQYAAQKGHVEAIKKLESIRGVSFDARDHEGFNVAIWASKKQQVQVLRYLIDHHADSLNATDLNGTTVLGFAFIDMNKRSLHTIHTLLDSELMDLEQKENDGITTFFRAVRSDNIQAARALVDREANVNAINPINGMTPLHYAAGFGKSPEMVRYLVEEAGANLNIRAADGMTPLEFAKTREETPQSSKDIKYEIIRELEKTTMRNE